MTDDAMDSPPADRKPILRPGETCWRIARAGRMTPIVDAADYFTAAKSAMMKARHSILLVGWDFDTRITLERDGHRQDAPNRLGRFLRWLVRERPDLRIHLLKWDPGIVQSLGHGIMPLVLLQMASRRRVRFKLDRHHPVAACHHQKIVVIDDALAFCGGIDITVDRWDTSDHADRNPNRRRPDGSLHGPWHDVTTAVDGEVARALGELARERWRQATGEGLPVPPEGGDLWPDGLAPMLRDIDVAIARSQPEHEDQPEAREIEALYLQAIGSAQRTIYLESQYFASRRIAEAIVRRLGEPEGPEIVVVNPETADGWLEEEVMGSARARLLSLIGRSDTHGRFRLYTPVTEGGTPIYVHAKVMVIDDRLLRVGSSNLNNRSLGLDTECDLAVEAGEEDRDLRRAIVAFRNRLLAEHLGKSVEEAGEAFARSASFIQAVEGLRGSERSLRPFVPPELTEEEKALTETDLLDPERPGRSLDSLRRFLTLLTSRFLPRLGWPVARSREPS
ncbi:phospholipase D-like domain-containing protein [Inquilinus sp. CAU 1745]|uniref:phospholipase D-like domain-containing protein n=1 Tax=Inquilinus sp. CAU 1745 TaxID=3140369 RepID=UPI00325A9EAA